VWSVENQGSTFTLSLPRKPSDTLAPPEQRRPQEASP
jgi:hypothetical protein